MCYNTDIKVEAYELALGNVDALDVFLRLRSVDSHCFILESLEGAHWSFIGWYPILEITLRNGHFLQKNLKSGVMEVDIQTDAPKQLLQQVLDDFHCTPSDLESLTNISELPPFTGGLMGYFSYDYIKYAEPTLRPFFERMKDTERFNDFDLMLFNNVIAINNNTQKMVIIHNSYDDTPFDYKQVYNTVTSAPKYSMQALEILEDPDFMFNEQQWGEIVDKAQEHIQQGDIFQVVLSNRMQARAEGTLFDAYREMRAKNPSPYMFYLNSDELEIAGCSPETLTSLRRDGREGNMVARTFPLAGTRPRGATAEEDARIEEELLSDEKERAEHNMLVDLGRNDIGRISKIGSVEVEDYMSVSRFSHVMHIGSKVKGILEDGLSALDVIESVLPAGTLSGAPKIRACEIIDCLEGDSRGIYGGCLGYLGLDGQMDMCITIRTIYKKGGYVYARSGAGIVMDSNARSEYVETINKIKSSTLALGLVVK
ncbi:MAG: anthranilate synthase component I family protein [Candidatus Ancillula sp.]|jgi:anthranilate synthase component 1|nr:anthranilate synthase component I family protein [Candidatus Ancillula sp.]